MIATFSPSNCSRKLMALVDSSWMTLRIKKWDIYNLMMIWADNYHDNYNYNIVQICVCT